MDLPWVVSPLVSRFYFVSALEHILCVLKRIKFSTGPLRCGHIINAIGPLPKHVTFFVFMLQKLHKSTHIRRCTEIRELLRLNGIIFTRDHSCSRSSCMRYFLCVLLCRCKPSIHSVYFPALQCQQGYSHFAFVDPRSLRTPSNLQENCTEGVRRSHSQTLSRQKLRMAHIARSLRILFRRTVVRIRHRIFHIFECKKVVHEHPQVDDILDIYARNRANFKRVRSLMQNFNC